MMRVLSIVWFVLIVFTGCGYKPVSAYTKNIFEGGVYVDIDVFALIPESGVNIKDTINEMIVKRFHSKLMKKEEAQSYFKIVVRSITQSPIAYNQDGFVSFYRTTVVLDIHFHNNANVNFDVTNTGYYDYSADYTSTVALENYRLESISNAAAQALDKFISQVAYYGEFY